MRIFIHILLFLILLSSSSFAADLELGSDEASYKIGDLINLRITMEGKGFTWGDIDKDALMPFEYAGKEESFSEESGKTTLTIKGHIFEVGEFTIPPVEIKDSQGKSFKTWETKVTVKALLKGDEQGIKPLKAQLEIDEGGPLWPWIIVALIVVVIVAAIWFFRRMKGEVEPEKELVQIVPPHIEALKELERIEELNLLREGRIKEYYSLISDAVRNFEGRVNGFDAMEMTTEELVETLNIKESKSLVSIKKFLADCDMVKFAKYSPPDMDISALMERARDIIKKDTPQEPPTDESGPLEERRENKDAL